MTAQWRAAGSVSLVAALLAPIVAATIALTAATVPATVQSVGPPDRLTEPVCLMCHIREEQRRVQLEAIKAEILLKLGMEAAPNMTGRQLPVVTEDIIQGFMSEQIQYDQKPRDQEYLADEEDGDNSLPEKLWTFASRSPLAEGDGPLSQDDTGSKIVYFDLSQSITEMDLEQATLWLFVKGARHHKHDRTLTVRIHKVVVQDGNYILKEAMKQSIRPHHRQGYMRIEVKGLVRDWFRFPRENFGVIIETHDSRGRGNISINSFNNVVGDSMEGLPVLEVHVTSDRRRTKRTTTGNFCTDNSTETNCCRFPLVVDFHDFGWDWIIAPSFYHANYCSGNCPYVYLQKYPHTHIVQQVGGTSGPCCGPRKLSPIHMLYWDTFNHIRFDKLPNMIVDSCGCH